MAPSLRDCTWCNGCAAPPTSARLITRPWTVFTYMFLHTGLGHIFWNMILLWFGGRMFEDLLGGKRLLGYYLLGRPQRLRALRAGSLNCCPVCMGTRGTGHHGRLGRCAQRCSSASRPTVRTWWCT